MEILEVRVLQRENKMKRDQIKFDYEMQEKQLRNELSMKLQKLKTERDRKLLMIDNEEDHILHDYRKRKMEDARIAQEQA